MEDRKTQSRSPYEDNLPDLVTSLKESVDLLSSRYDDSGKEEIVAARKLVENVMKGLMGVLIPTLMTVAGLLWHMSHRLTIIETVLKVGQQ